MVTQRKRRTYKIPITLAKYGMLLAVLSGIVTSTIQIIGDYASETHRNEQFILNILEISASGAEQAAYELDDKLAYGAIESLLIYDFITSARIVDDRGRVMAQANRTPKPGLVDQVTQVIAPLFRDYEKSLIDEQTGAYLGKLVITVQSSTILNDFYGRSVRLLVSGLLRNLFLTTMLLYLFYVLLSRPLGRLARQLDAVDPRRPKPFFMPQGIHDADNEITTVAEAANDILTASQRNLEELAEAEARNAQISDKLRQSERLATVGQLVGGIAHDFNNILAVIMGSLETVSQDGLDGRDKRSLANALTAVEQGANLTSQLLTFSRSQPLRPVPIIPEQFLTGLDGFLRPALGERYDLNIVTTGVTGTCLADGQQLATVFLNLVINASHAMPDGGTITLEAANTALDEAYCANEGEVEPGDYIRFSVTDTGTGMSVEVQAHAFEPYFTTKAVGRGSGLGLAMAYGFAKQSGGHIKLYSQLGYGTTVNLYLPVAGRDAALENGGAAHADSAGSMPDLTGKRILIVEDNLAVLEAVRNHLDRMNAEVIALDSGEAAIRFAAQNAPVDAAILDVVLSGSMNGREVGERLRMEWPDLRIAFMSGYTRNALIHNARLGEDVILLQKPFTRRSLVDVVCRLLDVRP
ncbi:ATP-binding protein [Paracoccus sp. (in: a-proteobacteria)]|uniref:ATP-binding protein n=1 Tax=Paracoccus sp. TaxID=267 RepID=UPI003A870942